MISITRIIVSLCICVTVLATKDFRINGVVAPVFTPCDDDGSISYSLIPEYAENLAKSDIHYILIGGPTSEGDNIALKPLKKIIGIWLALREKYDFTILVQIRYERAYTEKVELAKYCKLVGVDAIFVEQGYLVGTNEEVADYIISISQAAPGVPIIYASLIPESFCCGDYIAVNVTEVYGILLDEIPKVFAGVTCDVGDALALPYEEVFKEKTTCPIYTKSARAAFQLDFGCSISPLVNIFPELFTEIQIKVEKGDIESAIEIQIKLNKIVEVLLRYANEVNYVPVYKAVYKMKVGEDLGPPLQPSEEISIEVKKLLTKELKEIGVVLRLPLDL